MTAEPHPEELRDQNPEGYCEDRPRDDQGNLLDGFPDEEA